MGDWTRSFLGQLATFTNGFAFGPAHWGTKGMPIIRIEQMLNPDAEADRFDGPLPNRFRLNDGDLLMSWSGTIEVVKWERGPALVNQHLFRVEPSAGVDSAFLFHLLKASLDPLTASSHGTTMKHIKRSDLLAFPVRLPAPAEQRRIGEILDILDDTIATTKRLIAKEQSLVQGILARLLGAGSWLHPERLRLLGDVLAERPGNGYSPVEAPEWKGAYLLGLGSLTTEGFEPRQLKNAPTGDPRLRRALLADGDLLVSRSNTREAVGLVGRFRFLDAPSYYSDLMMRLRPKAEIRSDYLELVLRSQPARRYIQSLAAGTSGSMVKIGAGTLIRMPVPVLDLEKQLELVARVEAATRRRDCERANVLKLRLVRAGLADDLLSGRVRTVPV